MKCNQNEVQPANKGWFIVNNEKWTKARWIIPDDSPFASMFNKCIKSLIL